MLLRLVPPAPLPTILFTLSFPTMPPSLPLPAAWEAHLQLLADAQLASPPSIHALDKSVAWTVLLDTVTFDLDSLTVMCVFIDGMREEWPLTNRCVDLLESVICDVNRSAVEAERERDPVSPPTSSDERESSAAEESATLSPPKLSKVKKRRSLLASLMASLVPSSTFIAPPAPLSPILPAPSSLPAVPEEQLACYGIPASRFLRRRARSTLVDAFRRFVVGELGPRVQQHQSQNHHYALWIARSTMRRAAEEMARLVERALRHSTADDEDDTDGSSVHTPLDSHDPAKRPAVLAPEAYHTYIALKALHHRVHDVMCRLVQAQDAGAGEAGALEVRSRRRAWSARQYLVGRGEGLGGAGVGLVGLAVPVRGSPLCRGWTADDAERGALVLRRARSLLEQTVARAAMSVGKSREAEDARRLWEGPDAGVEVFGLRNIRCEEEEEEEEEEDDEEDEFALNTPRIELPRPTSPPPLPWARAHSKILAPELPPIEDALPASGKLPIPLPISLPHSPPLAPDPAYLAAV